MVIDDVQAVFIKLFSKDFFRQRHAHGVGNALPQRAGGGFDAVGVAVFGMAGGFAVQLAEVFQIVDGKIVAREMQQAVQQRRSVAVGEHEAVAVGKLGIGGVVAQKAAPQHVSHIGHAHRRAGVAGIGLLDHIHREEAEGVCRLRSHNDSLQ